MTASLPLLELSDISFRYPGKKRPACDKINLKIMPGELYILRGDNGAGKTTLVKLIDSLLVPDSGKLIDYSVPGSIGMVSQNPRLVPDLSVLENIYSGHSPLLSLRPGLIKANREQCRNAIKEWSFDLSPDTKASELNWEQRQQCEWLEHILFPKKLLLLDEPKTGNTPEAISLFSSRLKRYLNGNRSIIWITHKNPEPDDLPVRHLYMKEGRFCAPESISEPKLIYKAPPPDKALNILKMSGITAGISGFPIEDFNLELKKGEIKGICGVRNQGLATLEELLGGWIQADSGTITYQGQTPAKWTPRFIKEKYIGYVPAERITRGSSLQNTLAENFLIREKKKQIFHNKEKYNPESSFRFNIKGEPKQRLEELSGGNIQKAILSREFVFSRDLIILCEAERGLDSQSQEQLHSLIENEAAKGKAVLLLSNDISFVKKVSHTLVLLHEGHMNYQGNADSITALDAERILSGRQKT